MNIPLWFYEMTNMCGGLAPYLLSARLLLAIFNWLFFYNSKSNTLGSFFASFLRVISLNTQAGTLKTGSYWRIRLILETS